MGIQAKRVPNDSTGHCEDCGKDLGKTKWVKADCTGCSKECVESIFAYDYEPAPNSFWPAEDGERNIFHLPNGEIVHN